MLGNLTWSIFELGCILLAIGVPLDIVRMKHDGRFGWLSKTRTEALGRIAILLLGVGFLGITAFSDLARDFDFSREYGELIGSHLKLVSFDPPWPESTVALNLTRWNKSAGREYIDHNEGSLRVLDRVKHVITGRVIVCNEDGSRYVRVLNLGRELHYLPPELRSHRSADVAQIIFVRQERAVVGYYAGSGIEAVGVKLSAAVVDVASGQLVAVLHVKGSPPGAISTQGLGWTASGPSASEEAASELLVWIESEEADLAPSPGDLPWLGCHPDSEMPEYRCYTWGNP